ncbi:50S ribosome-binding GTPase [Candidatus Pacearchaeota archaeon]|nr:50S ribosome-binding GTPase [Candidatus Pacearchaeota archaeon]
MPINASYEYINAEKVYLNSKTLAEKINALREMIKTAPKHKSSENLLAELKTRLKKYLEKQEKSKKVGKSSVKGIRKEGFQVILLGPTNSGKSSLLSRLTNAHPIVSQYPFTTKIPDIGIMDYQGVKAQIVDLPSIGNELLDLGIVNTADLILIVLEKIDDYERVNQYTSKSYGKKIIVINKADKLSEQELRRLEEKIKSKRLNALIISSITDYNTNKLKEVIFQSMNIIRVYTKEPHKSPSNIPVILSQYSTVKEAAESIRKGFSLQVKETHITGPSSKFPNQKVGLSHILKDKDIIEFHMK